MLLVVLLLITLSFYIFSIVKKVKLKPLVITDIASILLLFILTFITFMQMNYSNEKLINKLLFSYLLIVPVLNIIMKTLIIRKSLSLKSQQTS